MPGNIIQKLAKTNSKQQSAVKINNCKTVRYNRFALILK